MLPNGQAFVRATVTNSRHCRVDGECSLRFQVGRSTGAVVYAHGDVGGVKPCGRAMFDAAWNIEDGTVIEARGPHRDLGGFHQIDLCAASDAFLRRAP